MIPLRARRAMEYIREINLSVDKVVDIGQKILIKPAESSAPTYYYSNIQDITRDSILISVPSDEKGRPVGFRNGEEVLISIAQKGKRYGFRSTVTGRVLKPFFMLSLSKPSKIFVVELRQYFRVPVFLEYTAKRVERITGENGKVKYQIPKNLSLKDVIIKGHIHDISGGGAFITCDKKLEIDEHILISTNLDDETPLRNLPARVVRKVVLDSRREKEGYGVMFVDIDEKTREKIIKFCFKRQRELRRAGEL